MNHFWNRLAIVPQRVHGSAALKGMGIALTFAAVTLAWVPFRAQTLTDAGRMLATLAPVDGAWASFAHFMAAQLHRPFDVNAWFQARELWPSPMPPDFLATYKPVGLFIALVAICTFVFPNTQQIFAKFDPVLGVAREQLAHSASVEVLDWRIALLIAGMFVYSVLHLTRVSPFLYFQF